eukprot:CAMPEP_0172936350 /NCGR_PEP_ID=MMETSP1075-20121228/221976_1 /TAXON_ID=2916 /ORGANISM="Ceratium fusus, Strain PA161109" /LENGTH=592 /DNA_ID=CAMNT_0013797721 /DNA_START=14 /DNA_END=1793 /DNA_ORIENTATION=+
MAHLMEEKEVPQSLMRRRVVTLMKGNAVHAVIGCCLLLNTLLMFVQLQCLGIIADESLGLDTVTGSWRSTMDSLKVAEYVFATLFIMELLLNVYVFRMKFFMSLFNVLDTAIVMLTSFEIFVLEQLAVNMSNMSFFRVFRLAKLVRALKIVRVMTFFHGLRVLVATAIHSLAALDGGKGSPTVAAETWVATLMKGHAVHAILGCCVLVNTLIMFVQLQCLGVIAGESLGLDTVTDDWKFTTDFVKAGEYFFATLFIVELLLNLYAFRWNFFKSLFNVLDTAIVVITSLEIFVLEQLAINMSNISFFRVLRLAKLVRALKIVRVMTFFHGLRVLVATAFHSLAALFWSLVVMFIVMLCCATFLCQMLHDFVVDEKADLATRTWVNDMYGNGHRALYTVFEMTFSGCWPNFTSRVVKEVNPFYSFFFILYVTFVIFGMIRIISALFLRETMQQAERDAEIMHSLKAKKTQTLKQNLSDLFEAADTSGDGQLSIEELDELLEHPKVRVWLGEFGIDASDAHLLFALLDDGDNSISKNEFVDSITRLKGEARAQDLVPVSANVQRILNNCKHIRSIVDRLELSGRASECKRPTDPQ